MGFRLKIEGSDTIEFEEKSIIKAFYHSDSPDDSNAKSKDVTETMIIDGKILAPVAGETPDDTLKICKWSMIPAENADCYRKAVLQVIAASQVVREITFPHAFVVDFTEDYTEIDGVGVFHLVLRQKKDRQKEIAIEGGYGAE